MAKKKKTILEAVDTLSNLADLDVAQKGQGTWLDPAKAQHNQEVIHDTFQTINAYLQHTYQKDRSDLAEPEVQKGIRSMIQLAGEAVEKVDRYTGLFKGAHAKDEAISEFKKLEQFYFSKVLSKLKKETGEEGWELQGGNEERQILKDLDVVRRDQNYELFYMTYDDGTPFFTSNLLRHLRMVGNFDEAFIASKQQETVLAKLEVALGKELHLSAQKVIEDCSDWIDLFYKGALQHKQQEMLMHTSKAIMALFLAGNPKNLRYNLARPEGKCAIDYWRDFILYLRMAVEAKSDRKWKQDNEDLYLVCRKLIEQMSESVFLRAAAKSTDLELMHQLAGRSKLPFFASVKEAEQKVLQELQNAPSGPLMKILKCFRQEENGKGYDPLLQNNAAHPLFTLGAESLHTTVIHTPAPIHQSTQKLGEIVPEFRVYLETLGERKHFYVNLQDRSSWKEQERCKLLEQLSEKEEFSEHLTLITLSKDSDFYHQKGRYSGMEEAAFFCKTVEDQLTGGTKLGFYFSPHSTLKNWIGELIDFVHAQFFKQQKILSHSERLDFIEILYFFLVLKLVDQEKPDVLNFSCKDGIDAGSAAAAAFYAFARMLSSNAPWTEGDRDCLLFTLFTPALFVRHRSIDPERLDRALSALEHFESVLKSDRSRVLKACAKILPGTPFKDFKISEVA